MIQYLTFLLHEVLCMFLFHQRFSCLNPLKYYFNTLMCMFKNVQIVQRIINGTYNFISEKYTT